MNPRALVVACHAALWLSLSLVSGCDAGAPSSGGWPAVQFPVSGQPPASLSAAGLVRWTGDRLETHPDMFTYELTMPLFSDHALKHRAIWLPPGEAIEFRPEGTLEFPVGAVIIKSFLFPEDLRARGQDLRLIETRVLVRGAEQWRAWPYVWRADGSDADLKVTGAVKVISFIDESGVERTSNYLVPQRNQCRDCHDKRIDGVTTTEIIGPKARLLRRTTEQAPEGQLVQWSARGWLKGLPDVATVLPAASRPTLAEAKSLSGDELRRVARDYLDVNCAHCHSPTAVEGETSQLYLNHDNVNAFLYGVCKAPSSAGKGGFGRSYDIVPGQPDQSIMLYRLETTELGAMMPDVGRSLVDTVGTTLVRRWIEQMAPVNCER